jgi:hypothetical protein
MLSLLGLRPERAALALEVTLMLCTRLERPAVWTRRRVDQEHGSSFACLDEVPSEVSCEPLSVPGCVS